MKRLMCIISIICISSLSFFLFTGCPSTGGGGPSFAGTWVNSDYDGQYPVGVPAKTVITDNGDGTYTCEIYVNVADTIPYETITMAPDDEWTDSEGNLWVKGYLSLWSAYYLMKVHSDNKTQEGDADPSTYPTVIDPLSNNYSIRYRQ